MRRFPFSLVLALCALGCGGGGGRPVEPPPAVPVLGSASLDLVVGGGFTRAMSMAGTGEMHGSLDIEDPSPGQVGTVVVRATLPSSAVVNGLSLTQGLYVKFSHPEALAVGTRVALEQGSNALSYSEEQRWVEGPFYGDSSTQLWSAVGGTLEVASLDGRSVVFRLADVVLRTDTDDGTVAATLSGTVSGTIVPPSL